MNDLLTYNERATLIHSIILISFVYRFSLCGFLSKLDFKRTACIPLKIIKKTIYSHCLHGLVFISYFLKPF